MPTNWTRDQLVLAFELYCRTPFGRMHQHNPDIIALARTAARGFALRTRRRRTASASSKSPAKPSTRRGGSIPTARRWRGTAGKCSTACTTRPKAAYLGIHATVEQATRRAIGDEGCSRRNA